MNDQTEVVLTFDKEAAQGLYNLGYESIRQDLSDPTLINYSFWIGNEDLDEFLDYDWLLECLSLTSLPQLPEPQLENIPHLGSASSADAFVRNYLWTFEDIRMLIGSNMPIFGDADHPCVSLRLRDMKKPINILTGKHLSLIGWQITILHNL